MRILAIETSCDETALAIVDGTGGLDNPRFTVVRSALYSQIETHAQYGGVFPAIAKREHALKFVPLLTELLAETASKDEQTAIASEAFNASQVDWHAIEELLAREPDLFAALKTYIETHGKPAVDMIAVTSGPGLEPALWVGINAARALSLLWNIPMLPVNHMEGHIASVLLENTKTTFPLIALLISGGHTEMVHVETWGTYKLIGQTKDDAIGEAYDKVARMLGFPYPGGPKIAALAARARSENLVDESISFPRPMLTTADFDFSLSGLKTAILYKVQSLGELTDELRMVIAREFEDAVTEVLVKKVTRALEAHNAHGLIVGGGVIANAHIRAALTTVAADTGVSLHIPTTALATDNAVMIAMAGYLRAQQETPSIAPKVRAQGNLALTSSQA
ncbi:MAG: hypothetical protein RL150_169 [Candidatus Parcubacteria bacterium]|jgi:N6-L-threonylcarbamoyladenine synthase